MLTWSDLATTAESFGLRPIARTVLSKVHCSAGVRYGEEPVSLAEAVEAQRAAFEISLEVAPQVPR